MGIIYKLKVFLVFLIGSLFLSGYVGYQNNSQNIGIVVFIFCWAFLILCLYLIRNKHPKRQAISQWVKEEVLKRQNYHCDLCEKKDFLEFHHRVKVADNGSNDPDNLRALCPLHHSMVTRFKGD